MQCCPHATTTVPTPRRHCCPPLRTVQAADRLLLVTEALTSSGPGSSFAAAGTGSHDPSDNAASSGSDLRVHHVPLPASYLASNWPVQHVSVSACGGDIAAAGRQGLAVYNRRQEKWRLFGDISQVSPGAAGVRQAGG